MLLSFWYVDVEKREVVPDLVGGIPSSAKCLAAGKCLINGRLQPSDMDLLILLPVHPKPSASLPSLVARG